jgi:hypothetical protein
MADVEIPDPEETKELADDPFAMRVALCIAVYAIATALASFGGNNAGKDTMLNGIKASNTFAWYQAKSGRQTLYKGEALQLKLALSRKDLPTDLRTECEARLAEIEKKLDEYKDEMPRLEAEGKEQIDASAEAAAKDPYFDFAEVFLQLAMVLASVAILSKRRWLFRMSLVVAAVGVFLTADGFLQFWQVPGL